MSALHEIAERGMTLMKGKTPALRERLLEAHDLFSTVEQEFPALLNSLEAKRKGKRRETR
jgi:hypothetical protein